MSPEHTCRALPRTRFEAVRLYDDGSCLPPNSSPVAPPIRAGKSSKEFSARHENGANSDMTRSKTVPVKTHKQGKPDADGKGRRRSASSTGARSPVRHFSESASSSWPRSERVFARPSPTHQQE